MTRSSLLAPLSLLASGAWLLSVSCSHRSSEGPEWLSGATPVVESPSPISTATASVTEAGVPEGKTVIPADATEGPRDLDAVAQALGEFTRTQPYGQSWQNLVKVEPAPKDKTGLGKAKTHEALEHDRIEMQGQVQFLAETGVESRFGAVSIRALRVFRYGSLVGVQLVLDRIGRDEGSEARFKADVRSLLAGWPDLRKKLGFDPKLRMVRNDLLEQREKDDFPKAPLRIQLEPNRT
ncbi:MAG: hypothetical protein HY791_37345 [Deltaproteobacteria bacterium]|nr:hypothetical protein [Deltaproteobacteria bacterium]